MPPGDDDFGFVPDGPDDFGFEAAELHTPTGARTLVLPETTIEAGGPTTVAPGPAVEERDVSAPVDALPAGFRATGRRMTVLPEMTIEGSPTGRGERRTTTAPASTGYVAMEATPDPNYRPPPPPPPPPAEPEPSLLQLLGRRVLGRDLEAPDVGRFAVGGPAAVFARTGPSAPDGASLDAAARGLVDASHFGFGDEIRAGRRAAGAETQRSEFASPSFSGPAIARALLGGIGGGDAEYDRALSEERAAERTAREGSPWAYGGGQVLGSAPTMMLPGGAATLPGRIAVAGGEGLTLGMIGGAGRSEAEDVIGALDQPSVARDALASGALEGLLSAGTAGAGEGVAGPLARRLGRWVTERGDAAARAGVQSRLEGTGIWGGRAMRAADEMPGGAEALAGDLRRLGVGHGIEREAEGVSRGWITRPERALRDAEEVREAAGARMGAVLDRMDEAASGRNAALLSGTRDQAMRGMVDLTRVADEMEAIAREYDRIPVGGPQVARAIREQIVEPLSTQGAVRFSDAWRQRRVIDDMIRDWSQTPNLSTAAGRLRTARQSINRAMNDAAEQLDPALRAEWQQANRDFSVGAFVDDFGRGAERLSVGGGIGGAAGTAIENTLGQAPIVGAWAQREMAQQTRMAWPGLRAAGLEALAPRLRALGARGQQWAQTLEAAQRRGSTSLAAAHVLLQRRDPQYREAIEEMEADESGEE